MQRALRSSKRNWILNVFFSKKSGLGESTINVNASWFFFFFFILQFIGLWIFHGIINVITKEVHKEDSISWIPCCSCPVSFFHSEVFWTKPKGQWHCVAFISWLWILVSSTRFTISLYNTLIKAMFTWIATGMSSETESRNCIASSYYARLFM